MAKNGMTQAQAITLAIALINGENTVDGAEINTAEVLDKLDTMRNTLVNKSHSKINEKVLAQRSALSNIVLKTLAELDRPVTVSELQRANAELQTYNGEIVSGQRITAILNPLVTAGSVVNTKDKKKSLFALAK